MHPAHFRSSKKSLIAQIGSVRGRKKVLTLPRLLSDLHGDFTMQQTDINPVIRPRGKKGNMPKIFEITLTREDLEIYFSSPLKTAANSLGISESCLKM